jgi:hypothetical protein
MIESMGASGEKKVFKRGYIIAGSMTVVTVVHLMVFEIEQFLNSPKNSLVLEQQCFNCVEPIPSRARITPRVCLLVWAGTRAMVCTELSSGFLILRV